jgi:hypothetical protein
MPETFDRARPRWPVSFLLAVVLVTAMGALPTSARAQAGKQPAGELRWALHVTLAARWLDPAETEAFSTPFMVMYAIHDAMAKPMPAGLITPSLAESWTEAKDHLTYTFVLRKGVRFHNGEPFNAAVVKWNVERMLDPATKSKNIGRVAAIERVDVVDELTVNIRTKAPYPILDAQLARVVHMMPPRYVQEKGAAYIATNPIGTGPYRVVRWVKDDELVLGDLVEQSALLFVALKLLRKHLRVRRNNGQRRVHFVRHSRRQQSDGRKLVGLRELRFQIDTLGNVIHDDQPANHVEFPRHQRGNRDIYDAALPGRRGQPELVQIVDSGVLSHPVKFLHKCRRKHVTQGPSQCLPTGQGIHDFHLRVPRFDAVREIDRHHAHVDRLHNVFVEVFQALVLGNLLLQRGIQTRVLDGDSQIAR